MHDELTWRQKNSIGSGCYDYIDVIAQAAMYTTAPLCPIHPTRVNSSEANLVPRAFPLKVGFKGKALGTRLVRGT